MATIPPELIRWSLKDIQRICKVSLKTAQRWKAGQAVPPRTAILLLSRDLGIFDPAWKGWIIKGNQIVSPENWIATVGDVLSIQLTQAQLSAYRTENRALKYELEARIAAAGYAEDQPEPGNWSIALEG